MSDRMKVLVVDDDVVSRMVLMHLVDTSGHFEVHEAEDGEDAWRQLERGLRPAITFCDLRMPHLSGMELLARVKADPQLAHMPFVLASAASERSVADQASDMGANAYLVKPFQVEEVRALLAGLQEPADGGDEPAAQTVRRLGIDANRLLLYLGGLHKQLVAASPLIEQLLACGETAEARAQLARLREGCSTLGLLGAAAAFEALEAQDAPLLPCEVEPALDKARQSALRQSELARALAAS
ncbi:response regulator [Massilia solisilvae]|uniref:Response regulator n=1 Tax=Massilia solisilvae TaxID=1811225 RepID=A0ABT2BJI5_9BURK|nr:response regulator [Massilia solisilvae]MCS0608615.1 response regulator [Massilia solisilvae]